MRSLASSDDAGNGARLVPVAIAPPDTGGCPLQSHSSSSTSGWPGVPPNENASVALIGTSSSTGTWVGNGTLALNGTVAEIGTLNGAWPGGCVPCGGACLRNLRVLDFMGISWWATRRSRAPGTV